jgi:hypothetical protein
METMRIFSVIGSRPIGLLLVSCAPALAGAQQVRVGGEIRPRYEFRDSTAAASQDFTSMRVRAELSATLERGVGALVQIQDVRIWGEEPSTIADSRNDDIGLHQGWAEIKIGSTPAWNVRVGRQEITFAEERLVGALDWNQHARSFDGVRAAVRGGFGSVDVCGVKLADATAPNVPQDADFGGAYAQLAGFSGNRLDAYVLHRWVADVGTQETTIGGRVFGKHGVGEYRLEGAYQLGERSSRDLEAFLLAAQVTAALAQNRARVTLWYDYLSGSTTPGTGTDHAFGTLFATNHKFYGIADLFTDIPAHTGGHGLQDAALKLALMPVTNLQLAIDGHAFRVARQGTLASARLGEELDAVATYPYSTNLVASCGVAWVVDGPALRSLNRLQGDLTWVYVTFDVKF